jgi:hypothetical protein
MAAMKSWLRRLETRTLVWLAKGRTSSWVIVGVLATSGLGAAALSSQSTVSGQGQPVVAPSTLPVSAYGCINDPDGDGHIFCDGSVNISKLPASFGPCMTQDFEGTRIFCRGTGD